MATYFGRQTYNTDDWLTGGGVTIWHEAGYTCPGSGNQNVQELSALCRLISSTSNIRLGIYNSSRSTLIGEGTSEVAIVGGSLSWQGHMSQSAVKAAGGSSPCVLVGGTTYILAMSYDATGSGVNFGYQDPVTSGWSYIDRDYTGGFASSLEIGFDQNIEYCIRCGVDAAAAGAKPQPTRVFRGPFVGPFEGCFQ